MTVVAARTASPVEPIAAAGQRSLAIERAAIAAAAAVYLLAFQAEVPNGDGRVYIRLIESGQIVWNPNHLLMQPAGLLWCTVLKGLGFAGGTFASLKLLSGLSAVLALAIIHAALPFPDRLRRLSITAAIFFSAHFLSMAIAEEYYMLQMPVVAAIFLLGVRLVHGADPDHERPRLVLAGVLAATAAAISINNALLAAALGPLLAFIPRRARRSRLQRLALVWVAGAAFGIPLVMGAYLASGTHASLLNWLTAYQGDATSAGNTLYGIEPSIRGVIIGVAKLGFGFANSVVLLGGLGAFAEPLLRSQPLEFTVDVPNTAAMGLLFLLVALTAAAVVLWLARARNRTPLVRFALGWIGAYLVFNLVFNDNSDQFWMQVLPAAWLLVGVFAASDAGRLRWASIGLVTVVVLLAFVNTAAVSMPRAFTGTAANRAAFERILHDGDLVVTPGWDDLLWLAGDEQRQVARVLLMDVAAAERRGEPAARGLQARIDTHLRSGRRVLVARLFDLDREGRPWEQLTRLGWPRRRLQSLLSGYEAKPVATIDDVVIRELVVRTPDPATGR